MDATEQYILLLRYLVIEKNAIGERELRLILAAEEPLLPLVEWELMLNSQEKLAFNKCFKRIGAEINWPRVQLAVRELLVYVVAQAFWRTFENRQTELTFPNIAPNTTTSPTFGVMWCGKFVRSGLSSILFNPNRPYFYRAPSLFVETMRDSGHQLTFLRFDEDLALADLDGTKRKLHETADILYFSSHGEFGANGYTAMLNVSDWLLRRTQIGTNNPVVAVFDTCHLIDPATNWKSHWANSIGPSVRLLLGFEGLAAIDRGSAIRGRAFAEGITNGKSFADAWLQAIKSTSASPYDKAIAIAIGDSNADAQSVLTSTIGNLPGRRAGQPPIFALRR